jgi:hypothetical protein
MPLVLAGTLPVSAINVGLAGALPGLAIEIGKLTADITDVAPAVVGKLQVTATFPPNPVLFGAGFAAQLNPAAVAGSLGSLSGTGGTANLSLVAKIGFLEGQISAMGAITGALGAGLNAGGIAGWNYAGRVAGFGPELERATSGGYPGANPDDVISGVVIATESLSSWVAFSEGFSTGASSTLPVEAGAARLLFMGALDGGEWNGSVAGLLARFNVFLGKLKGQKSGLEASAQVSLGLNLPSPDVILDAGLSVFGALGVDGLLANMVNVQADLQGLIGSIQAKIDAIVSLQGSFAVQLSAGGLSVWTYSGRAGDFGKELRAALANGLPNANGPNATAYGLAIAGSVPTMSIFGGIFIT